MRSPSLLSSCALWPVLLWPEAVSCWSILRPFCRLFACVHAPPPHHLRFQPVPHSSCPLLVMPALCPSCSTRSQTSLRAAAMKTLRRRRKIFHMFSLGAGTRLHGVARAWVCECWLGASCMFSEPKRLLTNSTQIWQCGIRSCPINRLVWLLSFVISCSYHRDFYLIKDFVF